MPLLDAHTEIFRFQTPQEAKVLSSQIAAFAEDSLSVQLGLSELMLNAIEHGICGIGRKRKAQFLQDDRWPDALLEKLSEAPYRDRHVDVEFQRSDDMLTVTITDPGEGFDWQTASQLSAEDYSGRGMKIVQDLVFDTVTYNDVGNSVTVTAPADAMP